MLHYLPMNVSTYGAMHDGLFAAVYLLTVVIFVITYALLIYFVYKYHKSRSKKAYYYHGNNVLEFTWTLLPTLLFIGLGLYSDPIWDTMKYVPKDQKIDFEVDVIGRQFEWWVRYPGADGVLGKRLPKFRSSSNYFGIDPNDPHGVDDVVIQLDTRAKMDDPNGAIMHLPVNKNIVVHLSSVDVLHSFFLPNFRVKQDAVPGMWVDVWFNAFRTGTYELACAELCGISHSIMRGVVRIDSDKEFEEWINKQNNKKAAAIAALNAPATPATPPAADSTAQATEEVTANDTDTKSAQ